MYINVSYRICQCFQNVAMKRLFIQSLLQACCFCLWWCWLCENRWEDMRGIFFKNLFKLARWKLVWEQEKSCVEFHLCPFCLWMYVESGLFFIFLACLLNYGNHHKIPTRKLLKCIQGAGLLIGMHDWSDQLWC